jgi:6-phosphogluconolactonase
VSISVHADAEALAQAAATWLTERALASAGRFAVSLAGGATPRQLYELLASSDREPFPWDRVHWFFGDERFVPHDHADSNFRMVRKAMLGKAPIPAENVHPIPTHGTPEGAAREYEKALQDYYGAPALDPQRPLFDVVLLGLGEDGHTASLFPGTAALNEGERWAVPVIGAKPEPRITLTYPALQSSCATMFLISGARKRDVLERVWRGDELPAARLRPRGELHWFIDRAADPRNT